MKKRFKKRLKGFTLIELVAAIALLGLLGGLSVISYKGVMSMLDKNYYKTLENNLVLAGSEYFNDNRGEKPIDAYSVADMNTLISNKYINEVKMRTGGACEAGNVYIAKGENGNYNYEACISCGTYQSTGKYCSGNIPGVILVTATSNSKSYNPLLNYEKVAWTNSDVNVTFSMTNSVDTYKITNTGTNNTVTCSASSNKCTKILSESGTYKVGGYLNNVLVGEEKIFSIKEDKVAPTFTINDQTKFVINDSDSSYNYSNSISNLVETNLDSIKYSITKYGEADNYKTIISGQNFNDNLESGIYTIKVKATDKAGNEKVVTLTTYVVYNVYLKYTSSNTGKIEVIKGQKYSYYGNLPVSTGSSYIWYLANNDVNNNTIVTLGHSHTLDSMRPTCVWSAPLPTSIYSNETATFTLTCTDNIGFTNSDIIASNITVVKTDTASATVSAPVKSTVTNGYKYVFTVTGSGTGTIALTLKPNIVIDTLQNKNTSITSSTLQMKGEFDNTAPTVTWTENIPTCINKNSVLNVNDYINTSDEETGVNDSEIVAKEGTTVITSMSSLTPGAHTLTWTVPDYAGNVATFQKTITIYTDLSNIAKVTSGDGLYADDLKNGRFIFKGANPDNYITFNNQTWRILSVEANGLIKIIYDGIWNNTTYKYNNVSPVANSSTYKYAGNSQIMQRLNDTSNETGTIGIGNFTEEAQSQISHEGVSHNIGDVAYNSAYTDTTTYNVAKTYEQEKSTILFTVQRVVGMPNLTDYLRASTSCANSTPWTLIGTSSNPCKDNNWMYNSTTPYWFINMKNGGGNGARYQHTNGSVENLAVTSSSGVRPVVYLKAGTVFTGNGTASNPYVVNTTCDNTIEPTNGPTCTITITHNNTWNGVSGTINCISKDKEIATCNGEAGEVSSFSFLKANTTFQVIDTGGVAGTCGINISQKWMYSLGSCVLKTGGSTSFNSSYSYASSSAAKGACESKKSNLCFSSTACETSYIYIGTK